MGVEDQDKLFQCLLVVSGLSLLVSNAWAVKHVVCSSLCGTSKAFPVLKWSRPLKIVLSPSVWSLSP